LDTLEVLYLKHDFKESLSVWITSHKSLSFGQLVIETLRKYTEVNGVIKKASKQDNDIVYMVEDQFDRLAMELNDISSKIMLKNK
jgi:hypothetical protein